MKMGRDRGPTPSYRSVACAVARVHAVCAVARGREPPYATSVESWIDALESRPFTKSVHCVETEDCLVE